MKVVELRGFGLENLAVAERPAPKPGIGQVLLKMRAWSLNYRDLMVVKGQYNPKLKFPFVPLSDGVGEVAEVGAGVTRVKPGQRVAGTFMQGWIAGDLTEAKAKTGLGGGPEGVLAEQVVLDADGVTTVPEHLTDEEAATLPCAALTAWNALVTHGNVTAGDTVLVQGTGGVSLFALQFARLHGAKVIATSSSDQKLERVKSLGAAEGINYKQEPEWGEKARTLSGLGVDHVVEVGGAGTLAQSLRGVRVGGTISLIGVLSGVGQANPLPILMKQVRLQGIFVGSREMFEAMNRAVALHRLRPVVDRVFGFSEIRPALEHMQQGAHFGKICLRWT
ncbi:MAG: NAD(P)-dependent alcohol dehydrogenase [Gemmataceae bacterium]|nr:NAD(P)-dependent alcohol dehydrogenase [Gemmataceae bacterium]MCI0739203.1 NAD(P)-dependent alcohol dehydrogenase [Gemmataceae bacterium]